MKSRRNGTATNLFVTQVIVNNCVKRIMREKRINFQGFASDHIIFRTARCQTGKAKNFDCDHL